MTPDTTPGKFIEDALGDFLWQSEYVDSPSNRRLLRSVIEDSYAGIFSQGNLKQAAEDTTRFAKPLQPKISPEAKARAERQAELENNNRQLRFLEMMFAKYPLLNPIQHNVDVVDAWVKRTFNGNYPFEEQIEAALGSFIYLERLKLSWHEPLPPPPPEPIKEPEPTEDLRLLKDGTRQLAIDCPEWEMLKASKAQLADLANRQWVLRSNTKAKDPTRIGSSF